MQTVADHTAEFAVQKAMQVGGGRHGARLAIHQLVTVAIVGLANKEIGHGHARRAFCEGDHGTCMTFRCDDATSRQP
jgi:hypothetical protein